MAITTGRPIGPLQYRVDPDGVVVGVYDSQGNVFPTLAYLSRYHVAAYEDLSAACLDASNSGVAVQWDGQAETVTGNITNFWDCGHQGSGSITRGSDTFYINPRRNQTNHVYVNPTGDDDNDGLTASFPFATLQAAMTAIADFAEVLPGRWVVNLAAGTYNETVAVPQQLRAVYPITIQGPTAGHPNVPTAIIEPASTSDDILTFAEGRGYFILKDVKLQGATTGKGINLNGCVRLTANNVHISGCLIGVISQHGSLFAPIGGIWTGRGKAVSGGIGFNSIFGSTHGFVGTSAANGVQITGYATGLQIQEGAQGHLDGAQVSDCAIGLALRRGAGECNTDDMAIDGCDVGVAAWQPWYNNAITFGATTPNTVDVQSRGNAPEFDFCTQDYEVHTERLVESEYGISHTGTTSATQVYQFANIRAWMIGEGGHTARLKMFFNQTALAGTCSVQVFLYDGSTEDFISGVTLPAGTETAVVESAINFSSGVAQRGMTWGTYRTAGAQGALCGAWGSGALDTRHTAIWIRVKLTLSNAADTATINWLETYGTFAG